MTAWDKDSAALAAFGDKDRTLPKDLAEAFRAGRLAVFQGGEVGPILVLADRVPANDFCESIAMTAHSPSFEDDGSGIAYAEHPTWLPETCVAQGRDP